MKEKTVGIANLVTAVLLMVMILVIYWTGYGTDRNMNFFGILMISNLILGTHFLRSNLNE